MFRPDLSSSASPIQGKGLAVNDDAGLEREADTLGARSASSSTPSAAPSVPMSSPMSGRSNGLPEAVQRKMESAFNTDFSNVEIHKSSNQATALGALAYTQGNSVHFAPGQYNPGSSQGQELIGHELAHVVQQREGRVAPTKKMGKMVVNDQNSLEREADTQGALAAQGKFVGSGQSIPTSVGGDGLLVQLKEMSSFPEGLTEEALLGKKKKKDSEGDEGGAPAQMKMAGSNSVIQMMAADSSGGVIQMRGGPTVGRLCVVSNAVSDGLLAGHAWLSYTPTGGAKTTYGTWGNRDPVGLHRDLEVANSYKARRCTDIDAADKTGLDSYATGNNSWSYTNNCASFAARGWLSVTGESLKYTSLGIPNPSALGAGISAAGGELAAADGGDSSASSGSSYGSSSLGSVRPGSSASSGSSSSGS